MLCVQTGALRDLEAADDLSGARPNILFIYTDDQSIRTVSCYPQALGWVETPNIDKLASEGIRFAAPYIGTWCMPSRAAMLTGRHQYGIESMRLSGTYPASSYIPEQCPFWPSVFRKHGYTTAQIGKWHTGADTGALRDWDYQAVWNRPRYPENASNYYSDQLIEINGGEPQFVKGYSTDNYTAWAEDFIRGEHRAENKPWYLWLCYGAVHGPYLPAERHRNAYPDITVPVPEDIYPPRLGKPNWMQKINRWVPGPDGEPVLKSANGKHSTQMKLSERVRLYQQAVMAVDEAVGRLMQVLDETGQKENTLVVFTSDQGFAWGQHGFAQKLAGYDANLLAPLIIRQPGSVPSGKVCQSPVGGIDLIPTFFNLAGIELPWTMHGRNLTPLLTNPEQDWPYGTLLAQTSDCYGSDTATIPTGSKRYWNQVPWYVMWREGDYKYIRTLAPDETEELYCLRDDPEELHNLVQNREQQPLLGELRQKTLDELRRTGAPFVENLPEAGSLQKK